MGSSLVNSVAITSQTTLLDMMTLPDGYRPRKLSNLISFTSGPVGSDHVLVGIRIDPNGTISLRRINTNVPVGYVQLPPIAFLVGRE